MLIELGSYLDTRSPHVPYARVVLGCSGGIEAGRRASAAYAKRYHTPADEYDSTLWKLDGVMEDLQAVYAVGTALGSSGIWPNWYPNNPFKASRDKMIKKSKPAASASGT